MIDKQMNAGYINEHGVILIERFLLKNYKISIYDADNTVIVLR